MGFSRVYREAKKTFVGEAVFDPFLGTSKTPTLDLVFRGHFSSFLRGPKIPCFDRENRLFQKRPFFEKINGERIRTFSVFWDPKISKNSGFLSFL